MTEGRHGNVMSYDVRFSVSHWQLQTILVRRFVQNSLKVMFTELVIQLM